MTLEKAMATHSSTLAWKIPWTEKPGGLQSIGSLTTSQTGLSDFTFTFHFHTLEKEMATHPSVLALRIPGMGEPGGLPSMGSHRVRHDWSDLAAVYDTAAQEILLEFLSLYYRRCFSCFFFFFFNNFIYLFIFGCTGSLLLAGFFLWLRRAGATL